MAYTLRAGIASGFTTKGSALDETEFDDNFIGLKAEIDALSTLIAAISAHTQNEDQYLDFGGSNQVAASDLKVLLDDIPLPSGGSQYDTLRVNSGATAFEISEKAFGYFYAEDTSDTTTISGADTATPINTTLSVANDNQLSAGSNCSFQNDSSQTKLLRVSTNISCQNSSAGDADLELICEVNSAQQNGRCTAYNAGGANSILLHWDGIISVPAGGQVEFKYINVTNTVNIRTNQVQISVDSID